MPHSYNPLNVGFGEVRLRSVWIVEIPDGETTSDLPSDIPVGSLAIDADTEKLYFKKTAGWREIQVATA